jgi:hypothetical protein
MLILEYFDAYVQTGLRPVALYPESKRPVGRDWNRDWSETYWRNYFLAHPESNIGILLGKFIDVEGDTELANGQLEALIGDCPHPRFRSSKSIHHLFLNPDPQLTGHSFDGFEFRAKGLQSMAPPSTHPDGSRYYWMEGGKFPPPPMPPALLDFFWANRGETHKQRKKRGLKAGHVHPWCSVCQKRRYLHEKRFKLEVQAFAEIGYKWQCHDCRECDVREACRRLRHRGTGEFLPLGDEVFLAVPPIFGVAQPPGQ